jgi:hypothetical protein
VELAARLDVYLENGNTELEVKGQCCLAELPRKPEGEEVIQMGHLVADLENTRDECSEERRYSSPR